MDILCIADQTRFQLSTEEKISALRRMKAENLQHYDARCPRCGAANAISRERLETLTPEWERANENLDRLTSPNRARRTGKGLTWGAVLLGLSMLCGLTNQFVPIKLEGPGGGPFRAADPIWPLTAGLVCPQGKLRIERLPLIDEFGFTYYGFRSHHAYCAEDGSTARADLINRVRLVAGILEGAGAFAIGMLLTPLILWIDARRAKRAAAG